MVGSLLQEIARRAPEKPFVIHDGRTLTYAQAARAVRDEAARAERDGRRRYTLYQRDSAELIVGLLAGSLLAGQVCVINRAYAAQEAARQAGRFDFAWMVTDAELPEGGLRAVCPPTLAPSEGAEALDDFPADHPDAQVIILTTGTTGEPKGVLYRWPDLAAQIQVRDSHADSRFLLAYPLNHFAGMQMLLHTLCNGATLVIPNSLQMADVLAAIQRHGVDRMSATATFWRFFASYCGGKAPEGVKLRSITLGGEACTGALLTQLEQMFPEVPISQVYAATEVGSCFSVRDLQKGFPAVWLDDPSRDPQMRIVDGELQIKSQRAMLGYVHEAARTQGDWHATGDMVRIEDGRVLFLGRKSETINVGGVKVHPAEIEDVIQAVPGVQLVRVYGKSNPVTGQIVAADVVPAEGEDPDGLKKRIQEACAASLGRYQRPRLVQIVAELPVANQKVQRRTDAA